MQNYSHEIGRVFRTAAWIWIGYQVSLLAMDMVIYANHRLQPVLWYHLINGVPAIVFVGLSHLNLVSKRPRIMAPVMIALISITPIWLSYGLDMRLPAAPLANLEGMVLRQLPVLFIGLALVAWNFRLSIILFYSLVIGVFELAIVKSITSTGERQQVLNFVIAIRTITLVVVGIFVNQLILRLRAQQEALKTANNELTHYASTLETLAVSRERNRLARELHDTLAHTLSGLSVQLETAKAYWDVQPETTYQLLIHSLATARSGLDETRRAVRALRASSLEDLGLLIALQKLSETAAERGRLKLNLVLPEHIPSLSPDVEQCVYRIAQEAIENVVKHANAENLSVRLFVKDNEISLTVQDDGQGSDLLHSTQDGHYGLAGMRERAEQAGGSLAIHSAPGQGTRVFLVLKRLKL